MTESFAAAMRRATAAVRTMDTAGATAIIRQALGGARPDAGPDAGAQAGAPEAEPPMPPRPSERPSERPSGRPSARPSGRPTLRDAVRTLRAGRAALAPGVARRAPAEPELPAGAAFRAGVHAGPHGSRRYRVYVPSGDRRRGLVLMLHGCTQSPEDFAVGTGMNRVAETEGLVVVYPEQTRAENTMACWNWFRPGDQGRGAGEPALLAGLAQAVAREEGVPAGRIFVAGLSAGGAMAAVLAGTYGDVFAAAGVHSGLAHRSAGDVVTAFAAMRGDGGTPAAGDGGVRLIVFQGDADATVHPSNAGRVAAAAGFGAPEAVERGVAGGRRFARGRTPGADGQAAFETWMVEGAGHAWSGGDPRGSYADAGGPDASAEMVRFFLD